LKSKIDFLTIADIVLDSGNKIKAKTVGASMYPLIRNGDIAAIKSVSCEELNTGDIIAVVDKKNSHIILHRLIYKRNNQLITRGDISISKRMDSPVEKQELLGVLDKIRRGRKIIKLEGNFYNLYASVAVCLSRHLPWLLFLPAIIVRIITTPRLFLPKSIHWFRKILAS